MSDEKPNLDATYVADYIACELSLAVLNDIPQWKGAKERQYLNLVLVCECGKRHRLRFGPDEP